MGRVHLASSSTDPRPHVRAAPRRRRGDPPEKVPTHSAWHVLTNFVGGPTQGIDPEIAKQTLADNDRVLLCSDGLTDMIDDAEVAEILGRVAEPEAAARALVERALDCGGRDNV